MEPDAKPHSHLEVKLTKQPSAGPGAPSHCEKLTRLAIIFWPMDRPPELGRIPVRPPGATPKF